MANASTLKIRDKIIEQTLPGVVFDGWRWEGVEQAALLAGYDSDVSRAVFPGRLRDAVDAYADWADRRMLERLKPIKPQDLRVRDRIRIAVLERFVVLKPYKEAVRYTAAYWMFPARVPQAGKVLWRTADRIWQWAGDTATDYNRYSKRGLLSGVLSATTLAWLDDESEDMDITKAFLDRRIENVMQLGKIIGKIKT